MYPSRSGALVNLPPRLRPEAELAVLDVTKYFGTTSGGIKTYLLEKMKYVASRSELRHILVVPGSDDGITNGEGSRFYQFRGPRIPGNEPYRFLLASRTLRRVIEHELPDLIEVGSSFLVPWLTRLANRNHSAPMVWYYHSHLPRLAAPAPDRASSVRRGFAALLQRYVRVLGERFPLVICGSMFSANVLRTIGVPRVARVPLGVDLSVFHPSRRPRRKAVLRERGIPDLPIALFAGRFAAEKRLDVVLDAWAEVERRTGVRLLLLGDGPAARVLRSHRYSSRVIWLPWESDRERFADLLAAADLYLAPGPAETFGLSALEAMASGTPVLSVDSGAVAELIDGAGVGGTYQDGAAEAMVEAATALCRSDLSVAGRGARLFAEREHAWDNVLDRLFKVYREVAVGGTADGITVDAP